MSISQVIGTWDDHDYGLNDAGKEFSRKVTNQRLLLDFLGEPQDSPRWGPVYNIVIITLLISKDVGVHIVKASLLERQNVINFNFF